MGLLSDYKEYIRMQDPRYVERLRAQEEQQRQEQQNTENRRLMMQYLGSAGSPAVGAGNDFGDDNLAAHGVSLPGEIEGYGYLGSDRGDAARMRFASNLLSIPNSPEAQRVGGAALQQYIQPSREQELVGKLKEFQQAKQTGVIPGDMGYQDFLQLGKSPGVNIHTGGGGGPEYIKPVDLVRFTDAEGNHPPAGTTYEQLYAQPDRYRVATSEGQKQQRNETNLVGMVDEAQRQLFGEQGIAHDLNQSGGPLGVFTNTARAKYQQLAQSDPRYKLYDDWRTGSGSQLLKSLGQVGSLSDDDVARGLALLPDPASDSVEVMQGKMEYLYSLADKAQPQSQQSQNNDPLGIR